MKLQILRLLVGLAVLGVLLAVVWLLGSVLKLDDNITHAIMLGVSLVFVTLVGLAYLKSLRGAASIEKSLKAQALAQFAGARPDKQGEVDELRKQFETALDSLRRSRRGKTALSTLPLYVLVGPPGSGKTTMLRESGIEFPFMAGRREIRGVGGTRNCDWWFGARGIMLDTAGRYMVQEEDREEWLAFLGMIRKARGRRAIDGAVVGIALGDIVAASELELRTHAEMLRERIDELTQQLGVVFPVYLVFTKCDQLAGFVEFFERLNKDERRQTFGFSVPIDADGGVAAAFLAEFDLLYRGLGRRRVQDFGAERGRKKKEKSYAFPLQFALTRQRIADFLGLLGQANPYQEASPLRGVYFTSGTQEGTVISQLQRTIYEAAEMEIDVPPDQRKCYFVDDLFEKVVFGDAGLAQPTAAARRRRMMLRWGGVAAAGVFGAWLAWASVDGFLVRRATLNHYSTGLDTLRPLLKDPWRPAKEDEAAHERRLATGFLEAMRAITASVPVHGDGDDTAAAVRLVVHDALRVSFVEGCVARAVHGAEVAEIKLLRPDEDLSRLDYAETRESYETRNQDLKAWIDAFGALTAPQTAALESAAHDKLQAAWIGCLAVEDAGYRDDAQRWLTGFLATPKTEDSHLLAVGARSRLQPGRLTTSVENATRNIGKLFTSFIAQSDPARQLPKTAKRAAPDVDPWSLDRIVGSAATGSECFDAAGSLPEFLVQPLGSAQVKAECEGLISEFHTEDATVNAQRAKQIKDVEVAGVRHFTTVRAEAWVRFLDGLTPKASPAGDDVERWAPREATKRTPVDVLARAVERAFELPEPTAEKPSHLATGHRQARSQLDLLTKNVRERAAVGGDVVQAVKEYLTDSAQMRRSLDAGYPTDGVPAAVGQALARLEQRVIALLERAAVAQVAPNLQAAWEKVKGSLETALNKFPFRPEQPSELTAEEFVRLFDDKSAYAVLHKIVATGKEVLGDGQPMFVVHPDAIALCDRLTRLREAFLVNGAFAPRPEIKILSLPASALKITMLGGTYDLGHVSVFYPVEWPLRSDLSASVSLSLNGQSWNLTHVKNPPPGPELRGLWSFVRMLALGRVPPGTDTVVWEFGSAGNTSAGVELKRNTTIGKVLLDVNDAFFAVKSPTLLFTSK